MLPRPAAGPAEAKRPSWAVGLGAAGVYGAVAPLPGLGFVGWIGRRWGPLVDSRSCSECTCGAPVGGLCVAQFKLYKDGACSELILDVPFSSAQGTCPPIIPPGLPIGGKVITAPQHIPGVCEPYGGQPGGTVEPEPGHEMTFCCAPDAM